MAGDLKEAHAMAEEGVQLRRKAGDTLQLTPSFLVMGMSGATGDVAGARRDYEEALTQWQHRLDDSAESSRYRFTSPMEQPIGPLAL
jgi:hypothetical protein